MIFPKLASGFHIESAQITVLGGCDEQNIPGSGDRAAHIWRAEGARRCEPRCSTLRRTERHLPGNAVSAQVYADERTPGRSRAGQTPGRHEWFDFRVVVRRHQGYDHG